jgi:hypothetical protein
MPIKRIYLVLELHPSKATAASDTSFHSFNSNQIHFEPSLLIFQLIVGAIGQWGIRVLTLILAGMMVLVCHECVKGGLSM